MKVKYEVNLRSKPHLEKVTLEKCGSLTVASVTRFLQPLTTFVPTPSQIVKIRKRKGTIRITGKAIGAVPERCRTGRGYTR